MRNRSTLIYRNTDSGGIVLESEVPGKYYHRFSDDSQYLIAGLDGTAKVYFNTEMCSDENCISCNASQCLECNSSMGYSLNPSSAECECDEASDYFFSDVSGSC